MDAVLTLDFSLYILQIGHEGGQWTSLVVTGT